MSKQGILVRGSWRSVELDPSLFANEDLGDLVCFEELTDYTLVDSNRAVEVPETLEESREKKKGAKKRNASRPDVSGEDVAAAEPLASAEEEESEGMTEMADKPPKKKKRKGRKKKQALNEKTEMMTGEGDTGEEKKQDAHVEPPPPKKAKKKEENQQNFEGPTTPSSQGTRAADAAEYTTRKRPKNWTSAALSGSCAQGADVSAWKDLFVPTPVLQALSKLGFSSPTPIQALTLPSAVRDRMDILGAAETGSGKTLSFGIPMIHTILECRAATEKWKEGKTSDSDSGPQEDSVYSPPVGGQDEITADGPQREDIQANADPSETEQNTEAQSDEGGTSDTSEADQEGHDEEGTSDNDEEQVGVVRIINREDVDFEKQAKQPLLGLVLTPTRELAVQVKHHIDAVAQFTGIRTAIVVGGMAPQKQKRILNRRPEIIIATPGRLWELIKERHPHLQNLRLLRCLVIDEADRMVERGHFAELESLLEMLNTSYFNPQRQTFVFSATLTMIHSLPTRLQQKKGRKLEQRSKLDILMEKVGIKEKPKIVDLTRKEATVESLTETRIHCEKEDKDFYLYYFLVQYPGRTMVFANSIDCIKRLNSLLVILDCTPLPLHANMHQKQRLKNLERFAERDNCVLLTTDVAARGLDIPDVQHVIHYQVPRTSETYVHRSGRTARAAKEGLSLLLIGPDDLMNFKKIYKTLGKDEDLQMFPVQTKCMISIKERVNLARKIEKIEYHNSKEKQHDSWFKQAAEAMDIDLDDSLLKGAGKDENDDRLQQKMVKGMKKHLKHLISQPIFKNVMKTKYPTQMGKLHLPELPLKKKKKSLLHVLISPKSDQIKPKLL
uniref:ATP-dependent RNA helicase n=1 Tax=Denticeps clupeoides TaxID=299321 RepID=A0AAY4ARK7_9TELE